MIPKDDVEKWMLIEHRALNSLRSAGNQWRGVGTFSQIFRFLIVPSFSSATAYSFSDRREPLDGTRFYCVRTTWDRQYDRERFESSLRTKADIEPTLEQALIKLSDNFAQTMLEQLKDLSLPMFVQCGVQVDGTTFEFSNGQVTLRWGESSSAEWSRLSEITLKFVQVVEDTEAK